MRKKVVYPANNNTSAIGKLTINVVSKKGLKPIENAKISVQITGNDQPIMENVTTDLSGQTMTFELPTPKKELSLEPNDNKPYSEYTINVSHEDYIGAKVVGTQLLPDNLAIQTIELESIETMQSMQEDEIIISPHTLYKTYPPKIPESEIKENVENDSIVLPKPVVPEYIVVHDGSPNDKNAKNYFVQFKSYIKNVLSSEIYATWPESAIQANALAVISFTLNRIYTEWYRNKGKNFTITSSTAFDQKFIYGRNIYEKISQIIDILFINYVAKPGITQPLFTQYCDGSRVSCPNWLSQWGSKYLADSGYSTMNILRNYYGSNIYLATAEKVSGIPSSFPGYNLTVGSRGNDVKTIQSQLNGISDNFPYIPKLKVDGLFGLKTKDSVQKFQEVFYLPPNGIVDYPTWYKISDIYVAVKRLSEL